MVENIRNKGLQEYTLGEKKGGNELFGSAYFFQLSPYATRTMYVRVAFYL